MKNLLCWWLGHEWVARPFQEALDCGELVYCKRCGRNHP